MSHYKRNADANRDALFGPTSSSKPSSTRKSAPSSRKQSALNTASASSGRLADASFGRHQTTKAPGEKVGSARYNVAGVLSGDAKLEKMKEAEVYREKATKALQRTMFSVGSYN